MMLMLCIPPYKTVAQNIVVPKILTSSSTFPHCQVEHK
uniref:Uncharacterized protein n=1 Tax=Medicago truncatula TaxID=3880 RepID=I3SRE4_MEDTR|nr:unknown [Medicago truncatula]